MLLSVKSVTSVWAGSRPPVQSSNTVRSPWLMEYMNWLLLGSLQDTGQIGLNKARSHVSLRGNVQLWHILSYANIDQIGVWNRDGKGHQPVADWFPEHPCY